MSEVRPARAERKALADLMETLGPDVPTLCTGWTTRDLAAHLVMRERRFDAAPGIVIRALHGHAEKVRGALAAKPYPELVDMVRRPPWWTPAALPPLDDAINTAEFFIHHEDVRRCQPDWSPRELDPDLEAALWRRVKGLVKLNMRRLRAAVVLHAPGYGEATGGAGGPDVRLTGAPGELTMFCSGRQRAARVQVTGPDAVVAKLRGARLGL
jgi:uncharacterized protein (TIGR03085 family)